VKLLRNITVDFDIIDVRLIRYSVLIRYCRETGTVCQLFIDFRKAGSVQFPAGIGNFPLHHHVQNSSGAHPASYPIGTSYSLPGGKAAGA
jgi:hypothetical protein